LGQRFGGKQSSARVSVFSSTEFNTGRLGRCLMASTVLGFPSPDIASAKAPVIPGKERTHLGFSGRNLPDRRQHFFLTTMRDWPSEIGGLQDLLAGAGLRTGKRTGKTPAVA